MPSPLFAQQLVEDGVSEDEIPDSLRAWIPWVLFGNETFGCTQIESTPQCSWPGRLSLDVRSNEGRFTQDFVLDRKTNIALPGNEEHWPQSVRINGKPWPVLDIAGVPVVHLPAGRHQAQGQFTWPELPEVLHIPPQTALVDLSIEGERISSPKRDEGGTLWLRARENETMGEQLRLEVHRRIDDGVPMQITTQISIRASGSAREVELGAVLPSGSIPIEISSNLPVRMQANGVLTAQIRAGTFQIETRSILADTPESLSPPQLEQPWPAQEIWVWSANETLRQTRLSGASVIDPARTNLPEEWKELPAYALSVGRDSLNFETIRRGEPNPPPNQLNLERELWLDLDGEGYTIRDHLHGTLSQNWRLQLNADELGHVKIGGEAQLITEYDELPGVEVRDGNLDLNAEWRLESATRVLPAIAWSQDVQHLQTTVHLPPGWSILGVRGVDDAPQTWIEKWNLFDLFYALLISLALGRLLAWYWGVCALFLFALGIHEPDMPIVSWVLFVVILALVQVLPKGRIREGLRIAWWAVATFFVVFVLLFAVRQTRNVLYPHLASFHSSSSSLGFDGMAYPESEMSQTTPSSVETPMEEFEAEQLDDFRNESEVRDVTGRRQRLRQPSRQSGRSSSSSIPKDWYDPNAIIQTGPGVPSWTWRSWHLSWSGPVSHEHEISLWLVQPWQYRILSALRAGLILLLMIALFRARPRSSHPNKVSASAIGVVALFICLGSVTWPQTTLAQTSEFPTPELLTELQRRLTASPPCQPHCISTSEMRIQIQGDRLFIEADVNAANQNAFQIPGPASNWVPEKATVDGAPSHALALLGEGFLFLRVEPGSHQVRLEGPIPSGESLALAFGTPPRDLHVNAPGWTVEGVRQDGRVSGSVQFTRVIQTTDGQPHTENQLPSWLLVTRTLHIGVRWNVETRALRVGQSNAPILIRVPLLPGEAVTESELLVEDDSIVVSLGRDEQEIVWRSVLEPQDSIALKAPRDVRWSERWVLRCSPIWHCSSEGLAPIKHQHQGHWEPEFHPWPDETLHLHFERPSPAEGRSTTIDSAVLDLTPGTRLLRASLTTTIRTTSGGSHTWTLPDDAQVQALQINGSARPIQQEGQQLSVNLQPGSQDIAIEWQQPRGMSTHFRAPKVQVGGEIVNAHVHIHLPPDRWLLWAHGPSWGPAILFWPYLLLVLLAAFLLARTKQTPLGFGQWALLGVGLTQIHVAAALVVVSWFFVLAYRKRNQNIAPVWFDLRQLVIAGWTLVMLGCLYAAVHSGLLIEPDMQVQGAGSSAYTLNWYRDRVSNTLFQPGVCSVPLWIWRVTMLVWALWLAWRLLNWFRWGWHCVEEGGLWKPLLVRTARAPSPSPQQEEQVPSSLDAERPSDSKDEN